MAAFSALRLLATRLRVLWPGFELALERAVHGRANHAATVAGSRAIASEQIAVVLALIAHHLSHGRHRRIDQLSGAGDKVIMSNTSLLVGQA